jgi:hypothetical protein
VTILFSDMVNYAGMTEALGDQASRQLLAEHHRIVRQLVERHGGREVKVQGDGFMMAFGGVARALRCAVEMQREFHEYSEVHADRPIQIHIGVHTGEAFEEDDDFLGHGRCGRPRRDRRLVALGAIGGPFRRVRVRRDPRRHPQGADPGPAGGQPALGRLTEREKGAATGRRPVYPGCMLR